MSEPPTKPATVPPVQAFEPTTMKPTLSWLVLGSDQRHLFKPKPFCGSETFTSGSAAQQGHSQPGYAQPAAPFSFFQCLQHEDQNLLQNPGEV